MAQGSRELFVSWSIAGADGRLWVFLLHLKCEPPPNGRQAAWWVEREVLLREDGSVRSRAPSASDRYGVVSMFPDPDLAIERGEMRRIPAEDFERAWDAPLAPAPSLLRRIARRP